MSVDDEKDRLGQKLRDIEKAREDQWAAEQDRKLLEKLRAKIGVSGQAQFKCPVCGRALATVIRNGLVVRQCDEHGAWLDKVTLDELIRD